MGEPQCPLCAAQQAQIFDIRAELLNAATAAGGLQLAESFFRELSLAGAGPGGGRQDGGVRDKFSKAAAFLSKASWTFRS